MKTIAIFSGSKLGPGAWHPGKKVWSIAFFGGSEVDFRHAELEEGITKMVVISIFGGSKIVAPPSLPVTLSGFSLLGGKNDKRALAKEPSPVSAKALHVNAISILGGCTITGESD